MANPGFSVSDLIGAVDWTIKFIIELNQVQDQVSSLKKDLETSRDQLNGLDAVLRNCHHSVNHRAAAFKTLKDDLHAILNDTVHLLKSFHPKASNSGFLSNIRQNLRWVVDSRYQGSVKGLQERISNTKTSILLELQLLSIHYHQGPRSDQPSVQQSTGISPSLDKETRPFPLHVTPERSSTNEGLGLSISKPHTNPSQSGPWVPVDAPPSPPPSPSLHSLSSKNLPETTLSLSPLLRSASTMPATLSPFIPEPLSTKGTVKVWFYNARTKREVPYEVKNVVILRDGTGYFRGIKMTRSDGNKGTLTDEISTFWNNAFKHPRPVHGWYVSGISKTDGQASNFISFLRDDKNLPRASKPPKYYSFSDVNDCRLFQSKVVGKQLLFWADVTTIYSARSKVTPACENQVLQLWESSGVRSIQFFRNGKDQLYSQHSVSSLRIESSSSKGLKLVFVASKGKPLPGSVSEQEQNMKYLLILFTNPKDMPPFVRTAGF